MISWICMTIAFTASLAGIMSIFKHPAEIIAEIREEGPLGVRPMQVLILLCLLGVQWSIFGVFGRAPFHGLSLLLYIVILWELIAIFVITTERGLDFLSEHLNIAGLLKMIPVLQSIFLLALILGAFGLGPLSDEFTTGSIAQQALHNEGIKIPAFSATWKRTSSMSSQPQTAEEMIHVSVNNDQFVISKSISLIKMTEIYSGKDVIEINTIQGGDREVQTQEAIPIMVQSKKFWLRNENFKKADDQENPPTDRSVTLYEKIDAGSIRREWVDNETGLVVARENKYGNIREFLELVSLDVSTPEASSFDPTLY